MKLSKSDKEILELRRKINLRFYNSCKEKLNKIKSKMYSYKAQQIYKEATNKLQTTLTEVR